MICDNMTECRKCGKELEDWEIDNFVNKCSKCNDEYVRWLNGKTKEQLFVKHIEQHLKELSLQNVCCKICGKTIDEIYQDSKK